LPDPENRWAAIPRRDPSHDANYLIVLVYFDRQAGFTSQLGGTARLSENGAFRWERQQPADVSMKVRLTKVPFSRVLSDDELEQLGLAKTPDWLAVYRDSSDAATQMVHRGSVLNRMGEPRLALKYLVAAKKERSDAPELAYEVAYAYNALRNFDFVIDAAAPAFALHRSDWRLCVELGLARLGSNEFENAVNTYSQCLSLLVDQRADIRAEIALHMADAYSGLGDAESCRAWLSRVAEWASGFPHLTHLRSTIALAQQSPGLCDK
jgi:tetratricopeptide (TPR) repeat protein